MRVGVGLTSLASFVLLALAVFVRGAAVTAKEGALVFAYVVKLFASAFTEGAAPTAEGSRIGAWQIMIGVLSLAMFASVFYPGTRWFLHSVAALWAIVMLCYYARMLWAGLALEIVCLPFLAIWALYYAACLLRPISDALPR